MRLKYDNITISGGVGVGTTTLIDNLKPYLEPLGWAFKSTGQMVREYMKENIAPVATLVSDDFDRRVEQKARELLAKEKHWVIEAWLSGFIAHDLKNTLKVLLVCSHDSVRIDRVVNRDKVNITEAKQIVKKREEENFKKWRKLYGNHNFFDPKYYNVVIDTYSSGQLETTGKVLDVLGYQA